MNSTTTKPDPDIQAWMKDQLNKGVYDLVDQGIFEEALVEAKPAWVFPTSLLIGKIRNRGSAASTRWFLCGDCETLHIPEELAQSPRDAMRHFSLLWQAQLGEFEGEKASTHSQAVNQAESLYELAETEELWLQP